MPTFRQDNKLGDSVPLIKTPDIGDKQVTERKLADGSVTSSKLSTEIANMLSLLTTRISAFKVADNLSSLPIEENTIGWLVDNHLYVYVGNGSTPESGMYQDCGELRGPQGIQGEQGLSGLNGKSAYDIWTEQPGNEDKSEIDFLEFTRGSKGDKGDQGERGYDISNIEQLVKSTEDGGKNIIRVTRSDGWSKVFEILNGSKGSKGDKGTSIVKLEQTRKTTESSGLNTIEATLDDGTKESFEIYNGAKGELGDKGEKGDKGDQGEIGPQGNSGIADASNKTLVNDAITGGETDFLSAEVGKLGILTYDCSKGGSVTHATLQDAINSVPATFQKVGLSITYKSGDTIYRYTLKANAWSEDPVNWFSVEDKLSNLSDTIGTKSSEESVILGQGLTGYIDATGTFQAQSGSTYNRVYRVDNLSNIKSIYAKSYEDSANNKQFKHIAFYDKSENYIDGVDFSDGLVEHTIIVPSNASYAYVFTHNDSIKPTVNIIAGGTGVYAEIDSINENIDVINAKIEDIENVTENPNTKIQSYSTYVRNPTNVGGETPIQFICRFKYGEATSPSKLRVRDNEGNYYPCQWEDVSSVNPAVDFVNGRWSDGSLRSGKLWIIANLPANKLSTFYIDILQEDQNVVQTVFYDASRLYCSKKSFILDTNGFNGSYYPCIMDNKTGNTINIHKSSDIKNKQITTEGNGVVYLDYTVRFHYKNLLFVEKYRLFYNGELYVHIYCTALEDVSCYSIHVDYYTPDKELSYVNNTVTYVKYQNSDVQTLVSLISISMDNLRAGNYSVLPSYFSVTNNHFYTGFRANGDIEIFKKGLSVSFYFKEANSPIDNYHYLQYLEPTGCITKTPYGFNKVKIKNICKSILLSTYVVMERMVGETNKTIICHNVPSVIMRGIERYNGFKLTDSSMYFKADIKEILGADVITLDIIKEQWNNSNIGFQHLNRFIPFAYNIWMYLEDDSEKEYYHNLLQCYGDFVSWVYETYNNIPLTKDNVVNSNSLASGLLALSMAYKVTGNKKYKTLYTSVEKTYMTEPYNVMGYMDNDADSASVSLHRYLHYQAYSRFTYLLSKYVIQEDNYPNLDVASTILMGIDSDGNPLDQEYTCSDSRRGSVQTLAYILGVLCGTPELDYQAQLGEICAERLKECFNGNNTEKFPINGFLNKGNTALSDIVIVNGILLQIATII